MMVTGASSFPSSCFVSRILKQKRVGLKFLFLLPNFLITSRSLCSTPSATCFLRFSNPTSVVPRLLLAVSPSSISQCQIIHSWIIKSGNYGGLGFVGDRLVVAYAKFGRLDYALNLFEEIPHKDLVSWNSMISVFSQRGSLRDNLDILRRMRSVVGLVPNVVTLISVLPACAAAQALDAGELIHGYAVKLGFWSETKVVNSLINMYGKCGSVDAACRLFQAMHLKTLVSWNTMVMIHAQNGFVEGAIDLFNSMRRVSIKPDRVTVVALLQSCADLAAERTAKAIHGCIMNSGFKSDVAIATALIIAYAKSGKLDASHDVFHELKYPDKIAWTAMLAGYATHGHGKEAITIFNLMVREGLEPDHVTFTHVLSACSYSGLVLEGKKYFEVMSNVYGVDPRVDHYSCMVDLLGRSGLLEEACELIQSMPINPNAAVWGALLGACRIHNNIELGKEVAERLFEIDPLDPRNYIILSNMYSAAGLWTDASRVRALMKDRGLKKSPGCSFIEHGNKIHRFVVDDRSHPESEKIHARLEELTEKMCQIGFVPKTEFVLHDVDEKLKEGMISKHSEKLAIAFGLLVKSEGMPIMITNNLRICGDCHSAAKFMSLIEKRIIVIRDSKRFHHFTDGLCSCGDYW